MTTSPTVFPTAIDYVRAVQHPTRAFRDPALQRAEFRRNPHRGTPDGIRGSYAMVFRAEVAGEPRALRFFLRTAGDPGRYRALERHVTSAGLRAEVPPATWTDEAILVKGQRWPMINTAWVDGRALDSHVEELADQGDSARLYELAQRWRTLMDSLQRARFAHGDLQHGNVLVDEEGTLRLVDFDCSWIAAFAGQPPPAETGHRNYQPENRPWGRWMDTFSGLVVYLSLRTLARNPSPWHELSTGENLLFARDDFRPPFDTPAWATVSAVRDPELDELAARLRNCCAAGWTANSGLDALIAPRTPSWWELTGAVPRPVPVPASDGAVAAPPAPTPTPPSPPLPRSPSSPVSGPSPGEADASGEPWWEHAEEKPAATPPRPRRIGQAIVLGLVVFVVLVAVGAVLAPTPAGPVIALALGILTTVLVMCVPHS